MPFIRNLHKSVAKSILIPLGSTVAATAATATDAAIHKKLFGSGVTTLVISNEEMNNTMKMVKSLEEPGLLIKGISKTIKNKAKGQKEGFLGMLLRTLGASLLGNLLTGKVLNRASKGTIRAVQDF